MTNPRTEALLTSDILAGLFYKALVGDEPTECPITDEIPDPLPNCSVVGEVPPELRGLLCLYATLKAKHSNKDKDVVWTWNASAAEAAWTVLAHSLRVQGKLGRVYIQLYQNWKYAAHPCC